MFQISPIQCPQGQAPLANACRCCTLLCALAQGTATAAPAPAMPTAEERQVLVEVLLAVVLNQEEQHETFVFLRQANGSLLASAKDIRGWRLRSPTIPPVLHKGEAYYPLAAMAGLSYRVDEARQSVSLQAAAKLFDNQVLSAKMSSPTPESSGTGGFLNYDGYAQYALGSTRINALAELGGFNAWGVGTLNVLGNDLGGESSFVRLDTTWTADMPSRLSSLRLGDAISRPGEWGGSARFGGIQWATNFATQSRFVSYPLPTLAGQSALPSTVDLYVNNALRLSRELPAGPFAIRDLPVTTGRGEARLVVKDLLGREQVITQPYYVSPRLLGRGLRDYSYDIGLERRNFGRASFDYGRPFAAGTHRYGFSDRFTGEIHGEWLSEQQTLGVNGGWLWPELGVFNLSLASSRRDAEPGALAAFGFERQARRFGFSGRAQFASEHFAHLGLEPRRLASRLAGQASVSVATGNHGSLSLGYIHQDNRDQPDVMLANASYNVTLGNLGHLSLALFRSLHGDPDPGFALTFTCALGERTSLSLGGTAQRHNEQATVQVQRNLPRGSGYGYRLRASSGTAERLEAGLSLQNDVGLYTVEASRFDEQTGLRGSVSGGVALMAGRPFPARRLSNSFALVQVPDFPDVRVYADNQLVGRTDAHGDVLVPQLRAYDRNPIRIEQADLPLDARIDGLEREAVPYFRSGYLLKFPVQRSRGAVFRIVSASGDPLPAGTVVRIAGQTEEFPVALRGEVYVTGLAAKNRLQAIWQGQTCEFPLAFPDTREPVPDLGTFACREAAL